MIPHRFPHERKAGGRLRSAGFTIAETMIVLAVTGVLFLIAFRAVGGKQNETEFQQAINDAQSSMEHIITQTETGDFQEADSSTCINSGGTVSSTAGSPATEGTSTACIFLGKLVQFAADTGSGPEQYITYPVAGLRKDSSGSDVTTIAGAVPQIVAPGSSTSVGFPDKSVHAVLQGGLSVASMNFVQGVSHTSIGAFGVMSSLGNAGGVGDRQWYLVPISGSGIHHDPTAMTGTIDSLNGNTAGSNLASSYTTATGLVATGTAYSVQICFASGTTNQSGLLTIGGSGGNLNSITTTIYSNTSCT